MQASLQGAVDQIQAQQVIARATRLAGSAQRRLHGQCGLVAALELAIAATVAGVDPVSLQRPAAAAGMQLQFGRNQRRLVSPGDDLGGAAGLDGGARPQDCDDHVGVLGDDRRQTAVLMLAERARGQRLWPHIIRIQRHDGPAAGQQGIDLGAHALPRRAADALFAIARAQHPVIEQLRHRHRQQCRHLEVDVACAQPVGGGLQEQQIGARRQADEQRQACLARRQFRQHAVDELRAHAMDLGAAQQQVAAGADAQARRTRAAARRARQPLAQRSRQRCGAGAVLPTRMLATPCTHAWLLPLDEHYHRAKPHIGESGVRHGDDAALLGVHQLQPL